MLIAAGCLAHFLLNAVLLLIILRLRLKGPLFTGLGRTFGRSLVCSTAALGLAWLILDETSPFRVLAGVGASILCYVILQLLLRDEFAIRLLQGMRRLLKKDNSTSD